MSDGSRAETPSSASQGVELFRPFTCWPDVTRARRNLRGLLEIHPQDIHHIRLFQRVRVIRYFYYFRATRRQRAWRNEKKSNNNLHGMRKDDRAEIYVQSFDGATARAQRKTLLKSFHLRDGFIEARPCERWQILLIENCDYFCKFKKIKNVNEIQFLSLYAGFKNIFCQAYLASYLYIQ